MYWQKLTTASTTDSHSRICHVHDASSTVNGAIANATANCWVRVLTLAIRLAGTLTPREPNAMRYRLIVNSRAKMIATGTHQNVPTSISVTIAISTRNLSASGSMNAPKLVLP